MRQLETGGKLLFDEIGDWCGVVEIADFHQGFKHMDRPGHVVTAFAQAFMLCIYFVEFFSVIVHFFVTLGAKAVSLQVLYDGKRSSRQGGFFCGKFETVVHEDKMALQNALRLALVAFLKRKHTGILGHEKKGGGAHDADNAGDQKDFQPAHALPPGLRFCPERYEAGNNFARIISALLTIFPFWVLAGGPNYTWPSVATIRSQAGLKSGRSVFVAGHLPLGEAINWRHDVRVSARPRPRVAGERHAAFFCAQPPTTRGAL